MSIYFSPFFRYTFLELRKMRTNYLVTFSIPLNSLKGDRLVIFSSTAGSKHCKKKQRRRKHVCNTLGIKFAKFFFTYFFKNKSHSFSLKKIPRIIISLKCKYSTFVIFKKGFIYRFKKYFNRIFFKKLKRRKYVRRGHWRFIVKQLE